MSQNNKFLAYDVPKSTMWGTVLCIITDVNIVTPRTICFGNVTREILYNSLNNTCIFLIISYSDCLLQPEDVVTTGDHMYITFTTDPWISSTGFQAIASPVLRKYHKEIVLL